ncbi:hypothetical protein LTR49_027813 [Elasticomyces elasticus]|nr:hypothetical protein LTR49_027813 [Elasticomyces elasticus]
MKRGSSVMLAAEISDVLRGTQGPEADIRGANGGFNVSEDGAGSDKISPYNARLETIPASPAFHPKFAMLTQSTRDLLQLLARPIEESSYRDCIVSGLTQKLENAMKSNTANECRIALVGSDRRANSEVISAILSCGMIVSQGVPGGCRASIVQGFTYFLPNQSKAFSAEIHFFAQDERHAIIRQLFAAIQGTVQQPQEFASSAAAAAFLATAQFGQDDVIADTLCFWADELLFNGMGKETSIRAESSTLLGLSWDIAPYLHPVEERDTGPIISLWPLVCHIRYGLDNVILKHNTTILDVPALLESDGIYHTHAITHLQQCTHRIVVAGLAPVLDDKEVRDRLKEVYTTHGPGCATVVLTRAENIDPGVEMMGTDEDMQMLVEMRKEVEVLTRTNKQMAARIKIATGMDRYELMEERQKYVTQLQFLKARCRQHLVSMRSRMITKNFQEQCRMLTGDPIPLAVFCLGLSAYGRHIRGYSLDTPNPPSLTVEATMIPALRTHLLASPAEVKARESREMVAKLLPDLLSSISLYAEKKHMDGKAEVKAMTTSHQAPIATVIEDARFNLHRQVEDRVLEPFRAFEDYWVEEARLLCRE